MEKKEQKTKTHQKVKLVPFEKERIKHMKIVRKPNAHTTLSVEAVLKKGTKASYVEEAVAHKTIEVKLAPDDEVIFSGIIQTISVKARKDLFHLYIEAVSHSQALDIPLVNRSYQDLSMTYEDLMEAAVEDFNGEIMDKVTEGTTIDDFIIQYQETPWAFIKRMASRFHVPLFPADVLDEPKVYVGLPDREVVGKLNDFLFNVLKTADYYRETKEGFKVEVYESDFQQYEVFSEKVLTLCDKITFRERDLYINEAVIELVDGVFMNVYKVTDKGGFHVNEIWNERIIGLSLEGEVVDVAKDDVQIMLDIDKPHPPDDHCWFKYATPYTSDNGGGFYNMPEMGEIVRLTFPTQFDKDAYSTTSVREAFAVGGERGVPDIKYWRTLAGKEIMFLPGGIKLRCLDDEIFLYMMEREGVLMQSSKPISIVASNGAGIGLSAEGKIVLAAGEEFDAFCNGSRINMEDGTTKIRGNEITEN